jgi:hypothetical protein
MKWFKHLADSHNDPDLNVAWDKFGDKAVIVFWTTLELYAKEFDKNSTDLEGFIPVTNWFHFQNQTRTKRKSIQNILVFFSEKKRIFWKSSNGYVYIKIPKFVELADNYHRLKGFREKQNDNKLVVIKKENDNKLITSKEVEVEEDKDIKKESIKKENFNFEKFWNLYPKRNGKKVGKQECQIFIKDKIKPNEHEPLLKATGHYANSDEVKRGYARDPIRFLKKDYWQDWVDGSGTKGQVQSAPLPKFNEDTHFKCDRCFQVKRKVDREYIGNEQVCKECLKREKEGGEAFRQSWGKLSESEKQAKLEQLKRVGIQPKEWMIKGGN